MLSPQLESQEAGEDGLALKKMIAAGAGIPLHFLAEPESATRTTAEAAGGPTYRRLEQRQQYFCWLVADVARAALRRWAAVRGLAMRAEVRRGGSGSVGAGQRLIGRRRPARSPGRWCSCGSAS